MNTPIRQRWLRRRRERERVSRLAVFLAATAVLGGCNGTTDPEGPAVDTVEFKPALTDVSLFYGTEQVFAAQTPAGAPLTAVFSRGSDILDTGSAYLYRGTRVGPDSLRASVTRATGTVVHDWRIWVDGGFGDRPAPVQNLSVVPGSEPSELLVAWLHSSAVLCPRPVVLYRVRLSYVGPIDEQSWMDAADVESVPYASTVLGYTRTYYGLAEGQTAWFAVRAEDSTGVLSPLLSVSARVPGRYQISGRLVDVDGQPLAGFRVSVGECPTCRVFSQTDGSFSLGPFRDLDTYLLAVTDDNQTGVVGAFYDFRSDTLRATSAFPLEIVMIGNHGISSECGSAYGGHFLDFLRGMCRTVAPRFTLNRWATYPIPYWVQSAASTGVWTGALDAVVHDAAEAWNERCGELPEMFVPAADSAAAAVVVKFAVLSSGLYGFVVMTRPFLGSVNEDIPETIHVTIHQQLNSEAFARGLALHELGHALCMGGHSECSLHIMTTGGHPVPTDQTLADALHPDEVLAARYVRQLPQGQDMRQYLRE